MKSKRQLIFGELVKRQLVVGELCVFDIRKVIATKKPLWFCSAGTYFHIFHCIHPVV